MKAFESSKYLGSIDYYSFHYGIRNLTEGLGLTRKEILILSTLLDLAHVDFLDDGEITDAILMDLAKELNLSSLLVHMYNLKSKGILSKGRNSNFRLNREYIPDEAEQLYSIRIINKKVS